MGRGRMFTIFISCLLNRIGYKNAQQPRTQVLDFLRMHRMRHGIGVPEDRTAAFHECLAGMLRER